MRHRVFGRRLSRDIDHRRALLKNLSASLLLNGKMETTLTKAKFVQPYVEKLITKAKKNKNQHGVKMAKTKLPTEEAVRVLFEKVVPDFESRNGGYTRIVKLNRRAGDNAPLARIELIKDKKSKKTDKKAAVDEEKKPAKSKKVTVKKEENE
ncbi:MAG: 50S ribosomal protein L17 [Patescibacteria group bacterium]